MFCEVKMKIENEIKEMMRNPAPQKRVGIIKTQIIRERSILYGKRRLRNTMDAVELVHSMFQYADKEMMVVLSLDTKNAPLALEIVSVGTVNSCLIQMRELFKHSILNNATSILCFHNHPSGIPTPSKDDIAVTKQIEEAGRLLGIRLLDHIIIGSEKSYVSLRERGIVKNVYPNNVMYEEDCYEKNSFNQRIAQGRVVKVSKNGDRWF